MQIKTILNRVTSYRSFVFTSVHLTCDPRGGLVLEVGIQPRANGHVICSCCGRRAPAYDRLSERRFDFIPLWNIAVVFLYTMRRVDCRRCGVRVERVPWAQGKEHLTLEYQWFLATWAKRLSWKAVADAFRTTWDNVFRSVRMAVAWGLMHRDLSSLPAVGVDEIHWGRGQRYLTLVYQINEGCKRLLWVGSGRTEESLRGFFRLIGAEATRTIQFVCSDMWRAYLNVIAERAGHALHVLDRFHIMKNMGEAIDKVRRAEARRLRQDGYEPVLKNSRWALLKRPANLTRKQTVKLKELLQYNLRTVRAYLLREGFQQFWTYVSPYWARRFLREWCTRTMRSRIEPMKTTARSLRNHESLILNWFRARGTMSSGVVEGFNGKAKLTTRKAYGFRTERGIKIALYHSLGELPEPDMAHRFC